jgi:hypothetical protein
MKINISIGSEEIHNMSVMISKRIKEEKARSFYISELFAPLLHGQTQFPP